MIPAVPGGFSFQSLTIRMITDTMGLARTGDATSHHVGERRCAPPRAEGLQTTTMTVPEEASMLPLLV